MRGCVLGCDFILHVLLLLQAGLCKKCRQTMLLPVSFLAQSPSSPKHPELGRPLYPRLVVHVCFLIWSCCCATLFWLLPSATCQVGVLWLYVLPVNHFVVVLLLCAAAADAVSARHATGADATQAVPATQLRLSNQHSGCVTLQCAASGF